MSGDFFYDMNEWTALGGLFVLILLATEIVFSLVIGSGPAEKGSAILVMLHIW